LSHAETVKIFQRACARAGIKIRYSQGFNPRPRLSLPLPRSVGVESEEELLCLYIERAAEVFDCEQFMNMLSRQLPEGCKLLSIRVAEKKVSLEASGVSYELPVKREYIDESLMAKIEELQASKNLEIKRQIDEKGRLRSIDVRPFLESLEVNDDKVVVGCKIDWAGTIRVDEILKLLELDAGKLDGPIRRTNVKWQEV
jgi:radical SAM-linked protein